MFAKGVLYNSHRGTETQRTTAPENQKSKIENQFPLLSRREGGRGWVKGIINDKILIINGD